MDTRIWLLAATAFLAGIDENVCTASSLWGSADHSCLAYRRRAWRSTAGWAGAAVAGRRQSATRRASHLRVLYTARDLFTPSLRRTPYNEIKPYAFAAALPGHRRW